MSNKCASPPKISDFQIANLFGGFSGPHPKRINYMCAVISFLSVVFVCELINVVVCACLVVPGKLFDVQELFLEDVLKQ